MDQGVDHGDTVVCPHCGHAMPLEGGGASIVDAVNAATARQREPRGGLDGFDSPAQPTLPGHTLPDEAGFPMLDSRAVAPWLPPDLVARSSEPAGFVVGEPDEVDDFDFNEPTLRPDQSRPGLIEAVNAAAVADPTPVDFAFDQGALAIEPAGIASDRAVLVGSATLGTAVLLGRDTAPDGATVAASAEIAAEQSPQAGLELDAEAALVAGDWKLRVMGLTYNFHGLDALIARATVKTGQAMQLSIDGATWKDFDAFYLLHKAGYPASTALAEAGEPGAVPQTPPSSPQIPPTAPVGPRNRTTMTRANSPELAAALKGDEKAKGGKDKGDAPLAAGRPSKPDHPAVKSGVDPASASSRRMSTVQPEDTSGTMGLRIAALQRLYAKIFVGGARAGVVLIVAQFLCALVVLGVEVVAIAVARARILESLAGGAATKLFGEAGDGEGEYVAKTFGGGGGTMEKVKTGGAKGFGDRKADAVKTEAKKEEKEVQVVLKSGGMDGEGEGKTEVARVIQRKNSQVQRCYEQALRDNPDEGGKVKVTFTVGTAGTITDVTVSGASGAFSDCIKGKFTSIRGLPLLPSPQSFSQSYVFSKS
jgi:outer membrane biosynthesis protein TonB